MRQQHLDADGGTRGGHLDADSGLCGRLLDWTGGTHGVSGNDTGVEYFGCYLGTDAERRASHDGTGFHEGRRRFVATGVAVPPDWDDGLAA
jgi:hypothetical protein